MKQTAKYKTRQRDAIEAYLRTIMGRHFTAADVYEHFRHTDNPIGETTVYRQLDKMVNEGLIKKYFIDEMTSACFEYVDPDDEHDEETPHYHCKCMKCGRLFHVECEEIHALGDHVYREHHFRIDPVRTIFYGVCGDCDDMKSAE